jgi:hypothetical protein
MFSRGSFVIRLLLALLFLGALAAAGVMLYQAGQAQGYALGLASGEAGTGTQVQPPAGAFYPGYYYHRPFFFPFFPFFGFLFWGGLIFFGFLLLGRLFRPRHWQYGGPHSWGEAPPWARRQPGQPESGQAHPPTQDKPDVGSL